MDISADTPKKASVLDRINSFAPSQTVFKSFFALFIILFTATAIFHEPWLDEAQAWMIARDASYYDMIFVIPHYEGHPPLWWIILSIPAKLGMPYEIGLKGTALLISAVSAYLIMFRSPFKPAARLTLPFTYFFLYQYGVISRPYVLMTLAILLAAMTYNSRNEKPFRFVLSLMLLCNASAFGIVISGGIALAWCVEILRSYGFKRLFTEFLRTRVFAALLTLLINAAVLIFLIMPYEETFTALVAPLSISQFLSGMYYMLFMLPSDCMLFGSGYGLGSVVRIAIFSMESRIVMGIPGMIVIAALADFAHSRRKLAAFLIPYILMAVFGSAVYYICHHIGTAFLFYVFICWICCADKNEPLPSFADKLTPHISYISSASLRTTVSAVCIIMGISWSVSACVLEVIYDYYYTEDAVEFIKDNGFDELNIMSSWYNQTDDYGNDIISADKQHHAVTINPYFNENIFFNLNYGDKNKGYILHRMSESANQEQYELWRNTVPDVFIGEARINSVYEDVSRNDYVLIKTFEYKQIFKLNHTSNFLCIYMRRDLLDDYPHIQPENEADAVFLEQQ